MQGMVVMWSGAIGNIPDGWNLCDGVDGRPDLRDKFIIGAGDSYDPADTGGANTHTHPFTSDGHVHNIPAGVFIGAGASGNNQTASAATTGTTNAGSTLPPYYALAFIIKE